MTKSFTLSLGKIMEDFDNLQWVFPQKYENSSTDETGHSATVDLPGYNKSNLKITVEGKRLVIDLRKKTKKICYWDPCMFLTKLTLLTFLAKSKTEFYL